MKLVMEIKDGKFTFDFDISECSKGHGEQPITADSLSWFSNALEKCHSIWRYATQKDLKEIEAMAYLEVHPEVLDKYREKYPEKFSGRRNK